MLFTNEWGVALCLQPHGLPKLNLYMVIFPLLSPEAERLCVGGANIVGQRGSNSLAQLSIVEEIGCDFGFRF